MNSILTATAQRLNSNSITLYNPTATTCQRICADGSRCPRPVAFVGAYCGVPHSSSVPVPQVFANTECAMDTVYGLVAPDRIWNTDSITNVRFVNCTLSGGLWRGNALRDVVFEYSDLSECVFEITEMTDVRFSVCNLCASRLSPVHIERTSVLYCNLDSSSRLSPDTISYLALADEL